MTNNAAQSINIWTILGQSLQLYKRNFFLFIGIVGLGYALWVINDLLAILVKPHYAWSSILLGSLGYFVMFWSSAAVVIAVSARYSDKRVTLKECFAGVKGNYWRFMGVSILYVLILGAGLLLLVIPGICWGTIFSLAPVAVLLEKRKDMGSFKISKALIKGSFWRVFLLWLIISAIPLFLYTLFFRSASVNQSLSMLLVQITSVFYVSFEMVVGVVLYHKVKEMKKDALPVESETPAKRNKGCLGCLGALGLLIVIIIISSFWISGLLKYFETDKGAQLSERIKKTISPEIVFPGNVTLERPEGYFVMKIAAPILYYSLIRPYKVKDETVVLNFLAYPYDDLRLENEMIDLGDEEIAVKIRYEIFDKNDLEKKKWDIKYGPFKARSFGTVDINDRLWAEYTMEAKVPKSPSGAMGYLWKIYYTPVDNYMLIAHYGYPYELRTIDEIYEPEGDAADKEKEVISILGSIDFPGK